MITGEEFNDLFFAFSRTAERLELRDRYRSEVEDEVVRRYLAGEPDDMTWAKPWLEQVRALGAEGKHFRRVRVVSVPLSAYQRCGVMATAPRNIEAGEDIRYLNREYASDLPDFDYWLFDYGEPGACAVKLCFDDGDNFRGAEVLDGTMDEIDALHAALRSAFAQGLPPASFAKAYGIR